MRLGVAVTGHWLELGAIQRLARRADELGYEVILVDGDAAQMPSRPEAPLHDSTALMTQTLLSTERALVGSIRLPAFWNAALLARSLATLQTLGEGRALGFLGVGAQRHLERLGLPVPSAGERVQHLGEMLDALRALLSGEEVTRKGRFVSLERARIVPPQDRLPIVVAAAGKQSLALAERYADVWDANVPPLARRLEPLRQQLTRSLETWLWIFTRPHAAQDEAARLYRKHCPWFGSLPHAEACDAVLWGEPQRCRERLSELREELAIDLPILDLAGLDAETAWKALESLAPAKGANFS